MAESKKILVSLPNTLLAEVDAFVSCRGLSRSELIREAMREYISHRKKAEIEEKLKEGYKLMAEINLEWAEMCCAADTCLYFAYEEKLSECE
ncbi:MAG: ribbon-helix-helix protein, CopG family [Eubacteriales bacterium]|nr:ribbon-helix-helix protein, CopG family [Eubacteriales bacterium]